MNRRTAQEDLALGIREEAAVALVGPRQVGKTTLALQEGAVHNAIYLDLESPRDRAKLQDAELYLNDHLGRLVILDEVHRAPELFPVLRGLIDKSRREGTRNGLYLLLGSASLDLLKQSGETLAGRVRFVNLAPFNVLEVGGPVNALWVRGGFPDSYLADNEDKSNRWRDDFIATYLERDIPQFGASLGSETMRRLWTMLAHCQGGILNMAQLSRSIGIDVRTTSAYVSLLKDLFLVRLLTPWHSNTGKRLVKSPKVYVRDSGVVHSLLGIADKEALLSHPIAGTSWEGFVIEQILAVLPSRAQTFFYRAEGGAEIDLLLAWPNGDLWAIEIKLSLAPRIERGFHAACDDLTPKERFVVYAGDESYPLAKGVLAISVRGIVERVRGA